MKYREVTVSSEDERLLTRSEWLEEAIGEFADNGRKNPFFIRKVLLGILVVTGLALLGFLIYQVAVKPKPVQAAYTKIEGIKRLGELHLVKHHYESIIPIVKKKASKQKLQFLLLAPMKISGFIDFTALDIAILKDSVLQISIPPVRTSKVSVDLSASEEILVEGKGRLFGKYWEVINHEEAYYDIVKAINETKTKVEQRALKNGIKEETTRKAQIFLQNFANTLGYRVAFVYESIPDSLKTSK